MPDVMSLPRVGPFMGVSRDDTRADGFRLLIYGAYNAMGLIGSEYNGIAVLNNNEMNVVVDNIGCEGSGYNGPSAAQVKLFEQLLVLPPGEFERKINQLGQKNKRLRYELQEPKEGSA